MNREDIIKLAREAGFDMSPISSVVPKLERFAKLVADAEREACAKLCEEEICDCCWDKDAQAAAEHLAAAIRARGDK